MPIRIKCRDERGHRRMETVTQLAISFQLAASPFRIPRFGSADPCHFDPLQEE